MIRAKKGIATPARPRSTRTGTKTSMQKALMGRPKSSEIRSKKHPQKHLLPAHISCSPPPEVSIRFISRFHAFGDVMNGVLVSTLVRLGFSGTALQPPRIFMYLSLQQFILHTVILVLRPPCPVPRELQSPF